MGREGELLGWEVAGGRDKGKEPVVLLEEVHEWLDDPLVEILAELLNCCSYDAGPSAKVKRKVLTCSARVSTGMIVPLTSVT